MPRIPLHTLTWSEKHNRYDLYTQGQREQSFLPEDTDAWLSRLRELTSFAFHGVSGSLNVYLEERPRGKQYWYAYYTRERLTRKRYLGQSARVTFMCLEEVATALGGESSPTLLASEHGKDEQNATTHRIPLVSPREVSPGMEVLSTRLSHPLLPFRLLAREHLLRRLDAARFHRLALLSASAGWGKTTLLSIWASRSTFPITWLSLDELDNDPSRFWVSVITALRTCLPVVGETALAMLRSPQPPPLNAVLTALLNDLSTQDVPTFLLLEDYHLIDEQTIHDSLLFVLDHLPAHLHLVLSSRVDPPLALARLRVRGQLLELRDADLRFEEGEATQFLTHTMDLSLESEEIIELTRRTEGWIAGLQLAGLVLRRRENHAEFVRGFTGGHRYVLDYVQEDILAHLSPSLQDFVLSTSILNRMSASLCKAVTEQAASQEMLETIERANLFLTPLDDERRWYRFHDLFREALLVRLQAIRPETVPLLHQRAACWYEEQGEFREAISHWLAAQDFSSAVRLMQQTAEQCWLQGEAATMYHWITALPDVVVREHAGFVLTAALYLVNAAAHTIEAQLTQAHQQAKQMMARVEHTALLEDRGVETGPQQAD
ncbi:MAG TPA: LuxR family transcriptional regulator, partial [Ktedonobacteraceae bacterium]|nr:LuxR family transcriptional regulator [Ktedonobacteraceae bacterium]